MRTRAARLRRHADDYLRASLEQASERGAPTVILVRVHLEKDA
jgi:hypothetical protein